ncbi:hypothetical protein POM88_013804 [Heracleum sosnowskyi]|uniref:Uncharacterized protein n=1 Tax=Heracleum sosnowskyi TaxID=360622 RepID=A0AAD8J0K0_9APIA|nr:hypothetical protein POM88_013804 [Heracleum sosnowskyi]
MKKLSSVSLQSLPIALIVSIMHQVLVGGFEDFFNFFIAWSQTQRPIVIVRLLEEFPLREIYKYGNIGSMGDIVCFNRFFNIVDRLIVADAIIYTSCRNLIAGVGSSDDHFLVLDRLTFEGHFSSMVANIIFRFFSRKNKKGPTLQALVGIYNRPYYERDLVVALNYIQVIWSTVGDSEIVIKVDIEASCAAHGGGSKVDIEASIEECLFCSHAMIVNSFSSSLG